MDLENILSLKVATLSKDSLESIFNISNVIIDKLIKYVIKKHDEGITFDQIKYHIEQPILQLNHTVSDLLNWLIKIKMYHNIFGFLDYSIIIVLV